MRKGKFYAKISLIFSFLMFTSLAYAESGDSFKYSLGIKTWYNKWTATATDDATKNFEPQERDSQWIFMVGPTLKVSYGKFYGGFSFSQNLTDYEFSGSINTTPVRNFTYTWTRQDLDIVLGYWFHPNISLFTGYKWFNGYSFFKQMDGGVANIERYNAYRREGSGLVFGVSANFPIETLYIVPYFSGTYMPLNGESRENANLATGRTQELIRHYNLPTWAVEGGFSTLNYHGFSASIGYKYQVMEWDKDAKDVSQGVTFSLNYGF